MQQASGPYGEAAAEIERLKAELNEAQREARMWKSHWLTARDERHHDVLCLVLKEFMHNMTHYVQKPEPGYRESMVNTARAIADLAYPPTHLCALVDCQKAEPHDHPISGPYCTPPKAEEP